MTDAAFSDRMGASRVIDRATPRRRVFNAFQHAMQPSPKTDSGRWWTKEKVAAVVFPVSVIGIIIMVWSVMALRMMGAWR